MAPVPVWWQPAACQPRWASVLLQLCHCHRHCHRCSAQCPMLPAPQRVSFSAATVKHVCKWHRHVSSPYFSRKGKKWQPEQSTKNKTNKQKLANATNLTLMFHNHNKCWPFQLLPMVGARPAGQLCMPFSHWQLKGPFGVRLIWRDFGALGWVRAQLSSTASWPTLVKKSDIWDRGCSEQKDILSLLPRQHCS